MTNHDYVYLTQDNHQSLKVKVPRDMIEREIKRIMNWRTTLHHGTFLKRLYKVGSSEFDACVAALYRKYPA